MIDDENSQKISVDFTDAVDRWINIHTYFIGSSPRGFSESVIHYERKVVKNPNWQEADQLAIYKHGWGVELGTNKKQLQLGGQSRT